MTVPEPRSIASQHIYQGSSMTIPGKPVGIVYNARDDVALVVYEVSSNPATPFWSVKCFTIGQMAGPRAYLLGGFVPPYGQPQYVYAEPG